MTEHESDPQNPNLPSSAEREAVRNQMIAQGFAIRAWQHYALEAPYQRRRLREHVSGVKQWDKAYQLPDPGVEEAMKWAESNPYRIRIFSASLRRLILIKNAANSEPNNSNQE